MAQLQSLLPPAALPSFRALSPEQASHCPREPLSTFDVVFYYPQDSMPKKTSKLVPSTFSASL